MRKKTKIVTAIVGLFAVGVILFFSFCGFIFVVGSSMERTYHTGDVVFYRRTQAVSRNDIIVFERGKSKVVKRVVGVAGDVVSIRDNVVYVNGRATEGNFRTGESADLAPVTVADGCVFVVGDNLTDSVDSRSYGAIKVNTIKGRVF